MSERIPLNVMIGIARRDIRNAVEAVGRKTNLPKYIIGSVLVDIRSELLADEIEELISEFTTEGGDKDDNADGQAESDT